MLPLHPDIDLTLAALSFDIWCCFTLWIFDLTIWCNCVNLELLENLKKGFDINLVYFYRSLIDMSRSIRAETRSRAKDDIKKIMQVVDRVRHWWVLPFRSIKPLSPSGRREKKWVTIGDTTMKIYKWVPVASEKKSKHKDSNKENLSRKAGADSSNSNFSLAEDSNTCESVFFIWVTIFQC